MWVLVMFDLPTDTPEARKRYRVFREGLLDFGFTMLQYSVYSRTAPSEESAKAQSQRVKGALPPDGQVRVMILTDKQYSRMEVFYGKLRATTENAPEQLEFF
jgi:CRISPR-associated protein Cas2